MSRLVAVGAAVAAAALGFAPAAAAAADATVDRTVRDSGITEASGMVASGLHPGVLWVHEDSGHPPRFFALDRRGRTAARITVRGAEAVDWEAMTSVPDASGRPLLVAGDIGDNRAVRDSVDLVMVREPERLRTATVPAVRTLTLRYPDGAHDAEALLADPRTNRLYIVTKGLIGGALYAVPQAAWPGGDRQRNWTLEKLGDVPMSLVTDGAVLPDGRMLLRNYGELAIYPPAGPSEGVLTATTRVSLPDQPQGETLAVVSGGRAVLVGSEGARQPVQRVALPSAPQESGAATSAPATPLPGGSATPSPVAPEAETSFGISTTVVLIAIAAVALLAVLTTVVFIALR